MADLYQFNPGKKSWKIHSKQLTSISGDDLTITPYNGKDLILQVSGDGNILFKEDEITYNLADLSNILNNNLLTSNNDASLNNVDISHGIINQLNTDNITEKTSGSGITLNSTVKLTGIQSSTNNDKLLYNSTTGEITYQTDTSPESDLSGLTDTSLSNLQDGDILEYNSTAAKWINATPSSGGEVSNPKVYGSIWVDADYVITGYTLWGGGNANPISTNAAWGADYDFINSHPNMWISPNTSQNYYWHGGTGNGNVLQIPRDGHYHITMHQLIHNSVYDSHTLTSVDMWIARFRVAQTGYYDYPDIIAEYRSNSSAADNIIWARATATIFCKAGDRIFGQFYNNSTGGTIVGDASNPSGMGDIADGYASGRTSGFSVFSID